MYKTINPFTGEDGYIEQYWDDIKVKNTIKKTNDFFDVWKNKNISHRIKIVQNIADILRRDKSEVAKIITIEMGKIFKDSLMEVEKCATVCDYYAQNGENFMSDEIIKSDASKSFIYHQPLGIILAVMPWNFPLWQVMRFLAPALIAGNTTLLKHASNVPQCALILNKIAKEAGCGDAFNLLMIGGSKVAGVIKDSRIKAVTLTGSENAGRSVASVAGQNLKKTVLELGGSDAFVVLADADIDAAVSAGVTSRFSNAGQSCVAAKRFILVEEIKEEFLEKFKAAVANLKFGDPMDDKTTLQTMSRQDLRDELHEQVQNSIQAGATAFLGCNKIADSFSGYQASILTNVTKEVPAFSEELFGPVAIIIDAKNEEDALEIANSSEFGLGSSVWSKDIEKATNFAKQIEAGASFVNSFTKSDVRLPFGGIKNSGYGRELSKLGMMEFVNSKTVWIR